MNQKIVIVGIDGVPYSFLKPLIDSGFIPNLRELASNGTFIQMDSVYPTISSVAWTTYATGVKPGKHNIFGFIDRNSDNNSVYFPNAKHIQCQTIWSILSKAGKRLCVINVPLTYPPEVHSVNGVMISGFLAPSLEKAVYPRRLKNSLEELGYIVDVDFWKGHSDKDEFMGDIFNVFERRVETMFYLSEKEKWDYFHIHFMGTDRLNHFFWEDIESGSGPYYEAIMKFYQSLDKVIGDLKELVDDDTTFIVLSDHGFCSIKKEVYLNNWLENTGYLKYNVDIDVSLKDISPNSKAYSFMPGRFYINLKGREKSGSVYYGSEYEQVRESIQENLLNLIDPSTGDSVISKVLKREDYFNGQFIGNAPDLIAIPNNGYYLRGNFDNLEFNGNSIFQKSSLTGMHTYSDASLFINHHIKTDKVWIGDLAPTILDLMGLPIPGYFDGKSLIS